VSKNLEGMNRTESKLYRLQLEVLKEARWNKMLQRVDFGKELNPYEPVPIKLFRSKAHLAIAWSERIEFQKDYAKRSDYTDLLHTMRHEMIHTLLGQNQISDSHGALFKTCCSIVGLHNPNSKEAEWKYKYVCTVCGWWQKQTTKQESVRCGHCFKRMVTQTDYDKLKQMVKLNCKAFPVKLEDYIVMKVEVDNGSWMKLKSGKDGGPTTLVPPPEVHDASVIHTPSVSAIPSVSKSMEGNT